MTYRAFCAKVSNRRKIDRLANRRSDRRTDRRTDGRTKDNEQCVKLTSLLGQQHVCDVSQKTRKLRQRPTWGHPAPYVTPERQFRGLKFRS